MKEQLEAIAEQKKHPLPTPPVGYVVQWYENNDRTNPRAAIVTKVEDPGKVAVTIFPPVAMPRHKQGVWHVSHEVHRVPGSAQTFQNGSWDYAPGQQTPRAHYQLHLDYLDRRENAITLDMLKREELEAARAKAKEVSGAR